MKNKVLWGLLFVACMWSILALEVYSAEPNVNRVFNGGFEEPGGEGWKWNGMYVQAGEAHSGANGCKFMQNDASAWGGWGSAISEKFVVKPGETLACEVYLKQENANSVRAVVDWLDAKDESLGPESQSYIVYFRHGTIQEWERFSKTFAVPEKAEKARFILYGGWSDDKLRPAITWFDDVNITTGKAETVSQVPANTLICLKTDKPPVIDGNLDDECWQKAFKKDGFVLTGSEDWFPTEDSAVYALYDDKNLYIAYKCNESEIDKIKATQKGWDVLSCNDDSVEFYFDINNDRISYAQFTTNSLGAEWMMGANGLKVSGRWQAEGSVGKDAWYSEIAIPFAVMVRSTPKDGEMWGGLFCRYRAVTGALQVSCSWCPYGSQWNLKNWGNLMFKEKYVPPTIITEKKAEEKIAALPKLERDRSKIVAMHDKHIDINLPGDVWIALSKNGKNLQGIANVEVKGVPLRNSGSFIKPQISTLERFAVETTSWEYLGHDVNGNQVAVHTKVIGRDGSEDKMDLVFVPREVDISGVIYTGFGYYYDCESGNDIFQIRENSTWEIGGSTEGNVIIRQSMGDEQGYYKLSYEKSVETSSSNRVAFGQVFDYTNGPDGTLITYYEKPATIDYAFYKRANSNEMHYTNSVCFGSGKKVQTPVKSVLFGKSIETPINEWTRVYDYLFSLYQNQYGIQRVNPEPCFSLPWYMSAYMKNISFRKFATVLPYFREAGYKRGFFNFSGFNWNIGKEEGVPYEIKVPEWLGGEEGLKVACDEANKNSFEILHWLPGHHMKVKAPIVKEHPDWTTKRLDGKPDTFGYPDIVSLSWRKGFREHYLENLKRIAQNTGLPGFWIDSAAVAWESRMGIDYSAPDPRPEFEEDARLRSEMQKYGYKTLLTEMLSPFGLGQGALCERFEGREFMLYNTSGSYFMGYLDNKELSQKIIKGNFYYRLLANKCTPLFCYANAFTNPETLKKIKEANSDYNKVSKWMTKRFIIEGDKGIEWLNNDGKVKILFAFQEFDYPVSVPLVWDVTSGKEISSAKGVLKTMTAHTYWMGSNIPDELKQREKFKKRPFDVRVTLEYQEGFVVKLALVNNIAEVQEYKALFRLPPGWEIEKKEDSFSVQPDAATEKIYKLTRIVPLPNTEWGMPLNMGTIDVLVSTGKFLQEWSIFISHRFQGFVNSAEYQDEDGRTVQRKDYCELAVPIYFGEPLPGDLTSRFVKSVGAFGENVKGRVYIWLMNNGHKSAEAVITDTLPEGFTTETPLRWECKVLPYETKLITYGMLAKTKGKVIIPGAKITSGSQTFTLPSIETEVRPVLELVTAGDIETGGAGWANFFSVDNKYAHGGKASLIITREVAYGTGQGHVYSAVQELEVSSGDVIRFEGYIRQENAHDTIVCAEWLDVNGKPIMSTWENITESRTGTYTDWNHFSKDVRVPDKAIKCNLRLVGGWSEDGKNPGITWFDDISAVKIPE